MILAIDVGNTNIVIGAIDKDKVYFEGRLATDTDKTEMEYAVLFKNILDIYDVNLENIEGAIISSVVPQLNRVLSGAIKAITGIVPIEVSTDINLGLKLTMPNKEEIGSDLLVASVAAMAEYKPPMVIIDMGTATTFWVIDADGVPCGGAFLPGVKISFEALAGRTAQLPSVGVTDLDFVIGKNTSDCIKSGIIHGTASMIDGMIDRINEELGREATVIATGGLARGIVPYCKRDIIISHDLLIKGLWLIYEMNK